MLFPKVIKNIIFRPRRCTRKIGRHRIKRDARAACGKRTSLRRRKTRRRYCGKRGRRYIKETRTRHRGVYRLWSRLAVAAAAGRGRGQIVLLTRHVVLYRGEANGGGRNVSVTPPSFDTATRNSYTYNMCIYIYFFFAYDFSVQKLQKNKKIQ